MTLHGAIERDESPTTFSYIFFDRGLCLPRGARPRDLAKWQDLENSVLEEVWGPPHFLFTLRRFLRKNVRGEERAPQPPLCSTSPKNPLQHSQYPQVISKGCVVVWLNAMEK
eukprot:Gb_23195 [translate_table: standard]